MDSSWRNGVRRWCADHETAPRSGRRTSVGSGPAPGAGSSSGDRQRRQECLRAPYGNKLLQGSVTAGLPRHPRPQDQVPLRCGAATTQLRGERLRTLAQHVRQVGHRMPIPTQETSDGESLCVLVDRTAQTDRLVGAPDRAPCDIGVQPEVAGTLEQVPRHERRRLSHADRRREQAARPGDGTAPLTGDPYPFWPAELDGFSRAPAR